MTDGYYTFNFVGNGGQRPARITSLALAYLMGEQADLSPSSSRAFIECNQSLLDEIGRHIEEVHGGEAGEVIEFTRATLRSFKNSRPQRPF